MHGGGAWRRYLLPVFLTLLNSAPSVEYRLNFFFFLSQKLTFIISFTSTSQCFSPLLTVLFVSTEHERVQAFYPFFRSRRKPGQQLMFKTNIETKKRALCLLLVVLHRPLAHPRVAL